MMHQRTKNGTISMFSSSTASTTYHTHHHMNGSLSNGASPGAHLGTNSSGHPHAPVTSSTQNLNGYVDYGPNGLLPTTSSTAAVSIQQYHSHFGNQQPQPHFYPNSANPFQQHHVAVAQHSTHYGSPTNHLFPKFGLGMQQSQQGPSQPGQIGNRAALGAAALSASGTFRSNLASNCNSVGSKQVNVFQSPSNSHHNVSAAAASPVIASMGASHHSTSNGGTGASKSSSTSIATSNANPSSFARGLQTAFNLAAVPFTPSSAALTNGVVVSANGGVSPSAVANVSASPNPNGYQWVNNKSIVKA